MRKFGLYRHVDSSPSTFQSLSNLFFFCKFDFYVPAIFVESRDFEGTIRECDTNLFRNVTYCSARVFGKKTSDKKLFVSTFLRLSFNAVASNHNWCQLIVRDCSLISRNSSRRLTENFQCNIWLRAFFLPEQYPRKNGCLSDSFSYNFGSQSIVSNSQPSPEQYTYCSALSSVFGTSSSNCSSEIWFFSCFLFFCPVLAAFVLPADIFSVLSRHSFVVFASFLWSVDNWGS